MRKQQGTGSKSHTHKFRRHRYSSGNITYFCALPDCSVKITPALALGKRCICWRCGEVFELTEYAIRLAKPHCENCHKPKKLEELDIGRGVTFDKPWIHTPSTEEIEATKALTEAVVSVATDSISILRNRLSNVVHKTEDEDI